MENIERLEAPIGRGLVRLKLLVGSKPPLVLSHSHGATTIYSRKCNAPFPAISNMWALPSTIRFRLVGAMQRTPIDHHQMVAIAVQLDLSAGTSTAVSMGHV